MVKNDKTRLARTRIACLPASICFWVETLEMNLGNVECFLLVAENKSFCQSGKGPSYFIAGSYKTDPGT